LHPSLAGDATKGIWPKLLLCTVPDNVNIKCGNVRASVKGNHRYQTRAVSALALHVGITQ